VAKIIPPQPYSVYVGQAYLLTVGVQYSVTPSDMTVFLQIMSESYTSGFVPVSGSGETAISLQLQAPPTPGIYTLQLNLLVRIPGEPASIYDSATVNYQVVQPVITDWDVTDVWAIPKSPGVGDMVHFYANILLKSTTSTKPLNVQFVFLLDKKPYYQGSLTFTPFPGNSSMVSAPAPWKATEGSHEVMLVVDPSHQHNDLTPYPQSNFKVYQFVVEAFYAIIQKIDAPANVAQGEPFNVTVTVAYKFPQTANLMIVDVNNASGWHSVQQVDTVKGSGTKDYMFSNNTAAVYGGCGVYRIIGHGMLSFDRGAGWQNSTSGYMKEYLINVTHPDYYARIHSMDAQLVWVNQTKGMMRISINVEIYLPEETGLRLTVNQEAGPYTPANELWKDESIFSQNATAKVGFVYVNEYWFTLPFADGNSTTLTYHATIQCLACGNWQPGDEATAQAIVPTLVHARAPPKTVIGYIIAAFQKIAEWFKKIFWS
jgi:hypothetical protein